MPKSNDAKAEKSAERFLGALRDVFVGAKVEGQSGFINLMRIKHRYYTDGVFPKLQRDIEAALKPFPGFKQELFDKLYDFFHRYFSPSGSIYFQHTPAHKNIYEKVYTDDRDVVLFWKTHIGLEVKSDSRLLDNNRTNQYHRGMVPLTLVTSLAENTDHMRLSCP
jgi:hypothetical protein